MHFDLLTNEQLHALAGNKAHLKFIRNGANAELQQRGLAGNEWVSLSVTYQQEVKQLDKPLPIYIKILLLFTPAIPYATIMLIIMGMIGATLLDRGKKRKWKQLWRWVTIGYVLWTAIAFGYALLV